MNWLRTREVIEKEEAERLAPFALRSGESAGRVIPEPEHAYRSAFQRDRDRVVHSRAFRRLEYKTQVFVHHEGDHYRNRLTHTLEGAQIARTIARALRLNEELSEAIALAHDLGHTPFGHAGERVLAECMREQGGFDHNRQSLRVVDVLEERYPDFLGLNLTSETREGMLKHGADWEHPVVLPALGRQRPLESQAADLADEIAYVNHDLDDGLRAGLLTPQMLSDVALWRDARADVDERMGHASDDVKNAQTLVALINRLVTDLIHTTAARIDRQGIRSVADVRATEGPLVGFSGEVENDKLALKRFLMKNFYQHPHVQRMTTQSEGVVRELFALYERAPQALPAQVRARFAREGAARAIADHIACMTDRFAVAQHARLRAEGAFP